MLDKSIVVVLLLIWLSGCEYSGTGGWGKENAPKVEFVLEKRGFQVGESVEFINRSTGVSSFTWDFGDGTSTSERSPVHIYSSPGDYFPELSVLYNGKTLSFKYKITVSQKAPDIPPPPTNVKIQVSKPIVSVAKNFNVSSNISDTIYWEFETGKTKIFASGTHSYNTPGRKVIKAFWKNQKTLLDSASIQVYKASIQPLDLLENEDFTFYVEADFATKWDFGDGSILNETGGTAAFDAMGQYPVKLLDANSGTILEVFTVQVKEVIKPQPEVINRILNQLANEGMTRQEKDRLSKELIALCIDGRKTPVDAEALENLDDLIKKLRLESDDFNRVVITTDLEVDPAGRITRIRIINYNRESI